jgi:hypothetical protein
MAHEVKFLEYRVLEVLEYREVKDPQFHEVEVL